MDSWAHHIQCFTVPTELSMMLLPKPPRQLSTTQKIKCKPRTCCLASSIVRFLDTFPFSPPSCILFCGATNLQLPDGALSCLLLHLYSEVPSVLNSLSLKIWCSPVIFYLVPVISYLYIFSDYPFLCIPVFVELLYFFFGTLYMLLLALMSLN